jgi:hypothetical protein
MRDYLERNWILYRIDEVRRGWAQLPAEHLPPGFDLEAALAFAPLPLSFLLHLPLDISPRPVFSVVAVGLLGERPYDSRPIVRPQD